MASRLPERRSPGRQRGEDDGEPPRLANRMGARRYRRFVNANFLESVVPIPKVEEDANSLASTCPFFQRGARFSECPWLAEVDEGAGRNRTPPRHVRLASSSRPSSTPSHSGAGAMANPGLQRLARLSPSERALLRQYAHSLESIGVLRETEAAMRAYLRATASQLPEGSDDESEPAVWVDTPSLSPSSDGWQLVNDGDGFSSTSEVTLSSPPPPRRESTSRRRRRPVGVAASFTSTRKTNVPACVLAPTVHTGVRAMQRAAAGFYGLRCSTVVPRRPSCPEERALELKLKLEPTATTAADVERVRRMLIASARLSLHGALNADAAEVVGLRRRLEM